MSIELPWVQRIDEIVQFDLKYNNNGQLFWLLEAPLASQASLEICQIKTTQSIMQLTLWVLVTTNFFCHLLLGWPG